MTKTNITNQIQKLENKLFYMEMANFINWTEYEKVEKEIKELKKMVQ